MDGWMMDGWSIKFLRDFQLSPTLTEVRPATTAEVCSPVSAVFQLIISDNYPKPGSSGNWWQTGSWMGLTENKTSGVWFWVNNATVETL